MVNPSQSSFGFIPSPIIAVTMKGTEFREQPYITGLLKMVLPLSLMTSAVSDSAYLKVETFITITPNGQS